MKQVPHVEYCHLCDCLLGWLHNATEHTGGQHIEHAPYLDNNCGACWASLASTGIQRVDYEDVEVEWLND